MEFDNIVKPLLMLNPGNPDGWNRVYATVAAANEAIPNNYVDIEEGGAMVSRSLRYGKVVQIGTVTDHVEHHWQGGFEDVNLVPKIAADIKVRSVTPQKTSFLVLGNYFNKNATFLDWTQTSAIGGIQTNNPLFPYRLYDFQAVEGGETLYTNLNYVVNVNEYDEAKVWLRKTNISGTIGTTLLPQTKYVRWVIGRSEDISQLNIALTRRDYETYGYKLPTSFTPDVVSKAEIGDISLIVKETLGKNKFNKNGAFLDWTQTSGTGGIQTNNPAFPYKFFTDYKPITTGEKLVCNSAYPVNINEYDSNNVWLRKSNILGKTSTVAAVSITIGANTAYYREYVSRSENLEVLQIENGTVSTNYEEYGFSIQSPLSPDRVMEAVIGGDNKLEIPSKQYLLKSEANSLYFQPISKRYKPYDFFVQMVATGLKSFNQRSVLTPTTNQSIKATMYDADFNTISEKNISTIVGDPVKNTGVVKALFMGDSWTELFFFTNKLRASVPGIVFLGTRRGHRSLPVSVVGEGRGGWTLANYFEKTKIHTNTSDGKFTPFLQPADPYKYYGGTATWISVLSQGQNNPVTGSMYETAVRIGFDPVTGLKTNPDINSVMWVESDNAYKYWDGTVWTVISEAALNFSFNFAKYRSTYGIDQPTFFCLMLGINDFSSLNPSAVPALYATWKTQLDQVIASVKADSPNVKFAVLLPPSFFPINYDNSGANFTPMKNAAMFKQRELLIRDYDNRDAENIYLVDVGASVDPDFGYKKADEVPFAGYAVDAGVIVEQRRVVQDNIHADAGMYQVGQRIAAFIQALR